MLCTLYQSVTFQFSRPGWQRQRWQRSRCSDALTWQFSDTTTAWLACVLRNQMLIPRALQLASQRYRIVGSTYIAWWKVEMRATVCFLIRCLVRDCKGRDYLYSPEITNPEGKEPLTVTLELPVVLNNMRSQKSKIVTRQMTANCHLPRGVTLI